MITCSPTGLTRLNDHNAHLVDQSRRLEQMRSELVEEIHQVRAELNSRIDHLFSEWEQTNRNIARLYEVIVRRDDYQQLQERVARIENQVAELRQKVAA